MLECPFFANSFLSYKKASDECLSTKNYFVSNGILNFQHQLLLLIQIGNKSNLNLIMKLQLFEVRKLSLGVSICLDVISIEISISTPKKSQSRRDG